MTWDMNNYPSSMKNLKYPIRKKAIDIANAMIDEGYKEAQAIPIATEQAKEWHQNANSKEIRNFEQHADPTKRSSKNQDVKNRPELLEKGEQVVPHENGWAVQSQDAKRASRVLQTKSEAIEHGKQIAKNKGTNITIHRQDGTIENRFSYES